MTSERLYNFIRACTAVLIAFPAAFLIIALCSADPLHSIRVFMLSPFSQVRYIGNIVELAIPLVFSGLAMSVLFKASLFNLGGEGVFYISGLLISPIAIFIPMPSAIHQIAIILAGSIAGCIVMLIPGFLKAKYNASELVTSLMLNSILLGIGTYMLRHYIRDPATGTLMSYRFEPTALLPRIIPGTRIHLGLVIALICVAAMHVFMHKTKWGYEIRMTGVNKKFAIYSGMNTFKVVIMTHVIAGVLAGMGGAVQVIGMHRRFEWASLPGYGFDGALIAMLGNNNPLGVAGAAVFVAYLRVGAEMVARLSDVPAEMISILQAIILLLVSAKRFLNWHRLKRQEIEVTGDA